MHHEGIVLIICMPLAESANNMCCRFPAVMTDVSKKNLSASQLYSEKRGKIHGTYANLVILPFPNKMKKQEILYPKIPNTTMKIK